MNTTFEIKPTVALFLDIDGVLKLECPSPQYCEEVNQKAKELFGNPKEQRNGRFTSLQFRIATSYYFDKDAVDYLMKTINKVKETAHLIIVLSSAWRADGTLEQIKTEMFPKQPFVGYIVDKTPDPALDDPEDDGINADSLKKYGFTLGNYRGRQIDYWLRENREKYNIKAFVIVDDTPLGEIKERFSDHFVQIKDLYNEQAHEKACAILSDLSFSAEKYPTPESIRKFTLEKEAETERRKIENQEFIEPRCMIQ